MKIRNFQPNLFGLRNRLYLMFQTRRLRKGMVVNMDNDTIFLYIIAALTFLFAFINCIQFLTKRNKTAQVIGTITSIKTPNPTKSSYRNSKWAIVSYNVNGKNYQSQKRIQVPVYSQIGTPVMIRYDKFNPEKLYCFSGLRIMMSLLIAAICILIVTFQLV